MTTVNVSGYVYYTDYAGVVRPLPFVEVAVWEDDGGSAYAALNNILITSSTGYYSTTVSHDDGDGSLELFLEVRSINNRVRVGNGFTNGRINCDSGNSYCGLALESNQYAWRGPIVTGVTGGSRQMSYTISDSRKGGAQLFKWLNDAANFTHTAFSPGQVRAVWALDLEGSASSLPDYNFNLIFDIIHGVNRSEDVAYHEYGHFTMFRRNPYQPPNTTGRHSYNALINPAFAWTEGWPSAFAQGVLADGTYDGANLLAAGIQPKVETAVGLTQNQTGAHNEFRVAAAVNDFYDLNDDGDDDADRIYSLSQELEIIRTTNIDDIYEFYNAALASGALTQLEKNRASRVMVQNGFPTSIIPETAPLNVSINGPVTRNQGQTGTWTATASGATGSYSYRWYKNGGDTGVTSQSYSTSEFSSFSLSVTVTSGGQTKSAPYSVSVGTNCDPSQIICPSARLAAGTPTEFALHAPAPNPSHGTVTIRYDLPEGAFVRLAVYDLLGREVARLADGSVESGYYSAPFEAQKLPAGVYVVRIEAGSYAAVRQVTVVR